MIAQLNGIVGRAGRARQAGRMGTRGRATCPTHPACLTCLTLSDLLRVDLGALQAAAEIHIHRLPLGEDVARCGPSLAVPVARRLRAAEREMPLRTDRRRVDVEDPGVHIAD